MSFWKLQQQQSLAAHPGAREAEEAGGSRREISTLGEDSPLCQTLQGDGSGVQAGRRGGRRLGVGEESCVLCMGCGRLEPHPCKHSIFPSPPLSLPDFPCGAAWRFHGDPEQCLLLGCISGLACFCHFPLSVLLLQTHKEDWLSRRIKNLLGDWDSKVLLSRESPLIPVWIPEKPKSQSQASSHRLASRVTNPYQDTERESSAQPRDLTAHPKQNYVDGGEGCSNQRSEGTAPQSKILPEPVKVSAIVGASVVGSASRPWEQHMEPAWLVAQPAQSSKALGSQVH